jgi:hypothetical protein
VAVTDALDRELGPVVAPVVRGRRWRAQELRITVPLEGAAIVGRVLRAWEATRGVALPHARGISRERLAGVIRGKGVAMDLNEYTMSALIKQRHAELVADARRQALLRHRATARRPLRVRLGTALIRIGAWLLREDYGTSRPTMA